MNKTEFDAASFEQIARDLNRALKELADTLRIFDPNTKQRQRVKADVSSKRRELMKSRGRR